MAIVKMNKFTLLTFESKKEELLSKIQGFSNVEFVNLQDEDLIEKNEVLQNLSKDDVDLKCAKYEENLSKAKFALEFLKNYMPKKSTIKAMQESRGILTLDELSQKVEESNWETIYEKVKGKEQQLVALEAKVVKLQGEIKLLQPFETLDTTFDSIKELKMVSHFIGTIAKQYEETLLENLSNEYIEIISRSSNDTNIFILTNKEDEEKVSEVLRGYGFSAFKTEQREVPMTLITDFKHEIEELKSKKFFMQEELSSFDKEMKIMELVYEYNNNKIMIQKEYNNFLKTKTIVTIQGWNCIENNEELKSICEETIKGEYYLNFEDVKEEEIDIVPIKLKNGMLGKAFEQITEMYSFPKYNELDPTPFLVPFYLIFFGMMVADVGYGLIVLIASTLALKVLNLDEDKRNFAKFFLFLSIPTIAFGLMYGSFFGDLIKFKGLIDPARDVNTVLILSLVLGIIQIFVGLGLKAYTLIKLGKPLDAFYDVGSWVITLVSIGVMALGPMFGLPKIITTIAMVTMIFGMIVIVLTGGRSEESKGARIGQGIYSLYGITGYIGDLVSYTRLMALGLAGGSIAGALNLLIGQMPGIAAIVIGPILFILAHTFNLLLSLLGAYVHTARLQYVEYFSKFYEGGGKPFTPFKTSDKYVKIKRN
ncbi:V-type ATP synthase subunit I [Clostridium gasigenes]|uniref:V-type ATP synthase subunit I n=1 Tax=Clostridium gasigenes TaxID=94869 RepID=UPI001C0C7A4B|nr:V-type ATP synthase subunit I [Clostridium gasigenes]MBU3108372.1 V-type ATP synthase subunit I [Clostridium gasigenes]